MVVVALLLKIMVPVLRVRVSPMASPRVVLFSTKKVEAVVEERVCDPTLVRELTNTSPSASTRKRAPPATAIPRRLVSAAADEGLMRRGALSTPDPATPVLHEEKVWGIVGVMVNSVLPRNVEVAVVERMVRIPEARMSPAVEREAEGVVVPMPRFPLLRMVRRSVFEESAITKALVAVVASPVKENLAEGVVVPMPMFPDVCWMLN